MLNFLKNNFSEAIGNIPIIKLKIASQITGCNIYGKCEFLNPGGSVKDDEVIKAADEHKISMTMTGVRHFKH